LSSSNNNALTWW